MKLQRRQVLQFAALAATLPAASAVGRRQAYPSRPVRLVVGHPPGGTADATARILAQWLSLRLGEPFIIENQPGELTNRAARAVVRAPVDGHTLLLISAANAINDAIYRRVSFALDFDLRRDVVPAGAIVRDPMVIAVNPSFSFNTFPLLLAHTQIHRGWFVMASVGVGYSPHLARALRMIPGLEVMNIHYPGDAFSIADQLGGRVQVVFGTTRAMIPAVKAGKLRAVAVTAATRVEALPDVPTIAETFPGYEARDWFGIAAPNGTPADIVESLNREINAGLSDPTMTSELAELHAGLLPGSVADIAKLVSDDTDKWNKMLSKYY
jgi:tripartite-type tricarboxylate transporter receptor subunit TctC